MANRLAAVYLYPQFVRAGGLFSYGPDENDPSFSLKRAAFYVDRILKGAKPAELPVEQPTKFVFGINLKTAKTLNIKPGRDLVQGAGEDSDLVVPAVNLHPDAVQLEVGHGRAADPARGVLDVGRGRGEHGLDRGAYLQSD